MSSINFANLTQTVHDKVQELFAFFNSSKPQADVTSSDEILNSIADNQDFIPINYGSYSVVFKYKDYPYIFKCSSFLDDGWLAFAEYARDHESVYLPAIYEIYKSENMYCACTEELEPIGDDFNIEIKPEYENQGMLFNACLDLSFSRPNMVWDESSVTEIKKEILNSYKIDEHYLNTNIHFVPVFTNTITELLEQGYQDDLHLGNIMIRDKYTIVINDPVQ